MEKIKRDPILGIVFKKFDVTLHPLTTKTMEASGVQLDTLAVDKKVQDLMVEGYRELLRSESHKGSPLHRNVVVPEARRFMIRMGAV